MMGHLKLGSAAIVSFVLAACASSTDPKFYVDTDSDADQYAATGADVDLPDEMQFGIDDDDEFEAVVTSTTIEPTAVASRVIYTDRTITAGAADLSDYSTVYGAIGTAGLAPTFDGDTEYTVFAPNNAAFSGLDLSGLSQDELADTLKYHTVAGRISSADLAKNLEMNNGTYEVTTLSGDTLRFMDMDGAIKVVDRNNYSYTVTAADNEFSNGYVHGINGVLGREY
ncbi:MAG: fasciclin domain-containing protein [Litorimonas sp.]